MHHLEVLIPVVPVFVLNPMTKKSLKTYAMLDCESGKTWILEKFRKQLDLPMVNERMSITVLGKTMLQDWLTVSLDISSLDGDLQLPG